MKRPIAALALTAVLALSGCSSTTPANVVTPSAPPTPTTAAAQTTAALAPSSSPSAAPPVATDPEPVAPVVEEIVPAPAPAAPASDEYASCVADALEADPGGTALVALCDDLQDFQTQMDDLAAQVAANPQWQCYLGLEETRPELFASGDPAQYGQDPEVVAVCG